MKTGFVQTHSKGRCREANVICGRGFEEISSLLSRVIDVTGLILSTELQQKVQEPSAFVKLRPVLWIVPLAPARWQTS